MGAEASKPMDVIEITEDDTERENSQQKRNRIKSPPPNVPSPDADFVAARRKQAQKPAPNFVRQLSEKTGKLLLFTLQVAQAEASGRKSDEEQPDSPTMMQNMSNAMMKMSSKALGLPIDDLVEASGAADALKEEDESVPSVVAEPEAAARAGEEAAEEETAGYRPLSRLRSIFYAARFTSALSASAQPPTPKSPAPGTEVAKLCAEHSKAIADMAKALQSNELYDPAHHDELWLLRFLLSAKSKVEKATADAAACLQWRVDHKMDQVAAKLRKGTWADWPGHPLVQEITPMHVTHPDKSRGTIVFQRLADSDLDRLGEIDEEEFIQYQLYLKEWLFQRRDATSRRTGTLAKNTIVLDMSGFSSKYLNNKRFKGLLTHKTIKTADEMYPQSLGTMVIVGLPGSIAFLFKTVVMPLAPKKVQEKIRVASDPPAEFKRIGLGLEHVPVPLGGAALWPPPEDARVTPP